MSAPKSSRTSSFSPHKIVGNLYYVGTESLASFPIVTREGNIPINSLKNHRARDPRLGSDHLIFRLEKRPREFRLPDDAAQRATPERIVKRNRNCDGRCLQMLLHDLMTSTPADGGKSILLEDATNVCPGEKSGVYPTGTSR